MTKRIDKRSWEVGYADGWEASKLAVTLEPEPTPVMENCVICEVLFNVEDLNKLGDELRCDDCAGIREGVTAQHVPDGFVAGVLHPSNARLWIAVNFVRASSPRVTS